MLIESAKDGRSSRASGRWVATALALFLAATGAPAQGQQPEASGVIVILADGTNLPLTSWSLSYEYQVLPQGATSRRDARDLFVGKKSVATAGSTIEIQYREFERAEEIDGHSQNVKVSVATGLVLTARGKKRALGIEAPHKDLLVPQGAEKGIVQARALDLKGLTLTGTKRSFCLLSYAAQVECHPPAGERVVKMEFEP